MKFTVYILLFFVFASSPVFSQTQEYPKENNNNIYTLATYRFIPESRLEKLLDLSAENELKVIFKELNLYSVKIKDSSLLDKINASPEVEFIEKTPLLDYRIYPDDEDFDKQYFHKYIKTIETWDINTGGVTFDGDTIVLAVIDRGIYIDHPDLKDNIWVNKNEIAGDNIDNDNNGYIDDYRGVNIESKNGNIIKSEHGTKVSGVAGAKGNNTTGVAGVNWNIKILPLTNNNNGNDVIQSYSYIYNMRKKYNETDGREGAFIVVSNLSAGLYEVFPNSNGVTKKWCQMYNILGQAGILNVSAATNKNVNVDEVGDIPTLCTSDYVIPVNSTDENDQFYDGYAYSDKSIDIAAPGRNIYTTTYSKNDLYATGSGNSLAAPMVAGAIALLYTVPCENFIKRTKANPEDMSFNIKDYLLQYSDKLPSLAGKNLSGGRLNVYNTYLHLYENECGEIPLGDFEIINIYPVPADGNLIIEYDTDKLEKMTFTVFNSAGQRVYSRTFKPGLAPGRKIYLNTSGYASGIYHFILEKDGKTTGKSFSVVHSNK